MSDWLRNCDDSILMIAELFTACFAIALEMSFNSKRVHVAVYYHVL